VLSGMTGGNGATVRWALRREANAPEARTSVDSTPETGAPPGEPAVEEGADDGA